MADRSNSRPRSPAGETCFSRSRACRHRTIGYLARERAFLNAGPRGTPAVETDGRERTGAFVTELTNLVDVVGCGAECRLICHRERPHPGARSRSSTPTTAGVTPRSSPTARATASYWNYDSVATPASRTGSGGWKARMLNPPFEDYVRNQAWTVQLPSGPTWLPSALLGSGSLHTSTGSSSRGH